MKYSVSSGDQILNSIHKLFIVDTYVSGTRSKAEVFKISNEVAGCVIFISRCRFSNNKAGQSPVFFLSTSKVLFQIQDSHFINNTGGIKVSLMYPWADIVNNNAYIDFLNEVTTEIKIIFQTSIAVLQVTNCTFLNSKSLFNAGGLSIETEIMFCPSMFVNKSLFTLQIFGMLIQKYYN